MSSFLINAAHLSTYFDIAIIIIVATSAVRCLLVAFILFCTAFLHLLLSWLLLCVYVHDSLSLPSRFVPCA